MLVFIHKIKNLNSAFYTIKIYRVCTVTKYLNNIHCSDKSIVTVIILCYYFVHKKKLMQENGGLK